MRAVLFATVIGLVLSLVGTPVAIRFFVRRGYGQEIHDALKSHQVKRGTPSMGGAVIVVATLVAYFLTKLLTAKAPTSSGLLVLFLVTGLGVVGFIDDFIKIFRQRSLGLRARAKLTGSDSFSYVSSTYNSFLHVVCRWRIHHIASQGRRERLRWLALLSPSSYIRATR